ncbi:MAG TPA: response regulator [Puia sp.]|jgi:DNA-binding NtrC family response regulator|nr:response regulator [Puia sp.]
MPGRVMIFDDDADLLEVCSIVLKSKNYEVSGLSNCSDILNEVRSFSPHVIMMDNWIPESGGIKATQELKGDQFLKSIPVIFFSANDGVKKLASEAGAEFFLQKPFELDDLENIVAKAISIQHPGGSVKSGIV